MSLKDRIAKLYRNKPVQPPAAPPPLNMDASPYELPVPFALEEFPRTFLHLLLVSKDTPDLLKRDIKTWLDDYEPRLNEYMYGRYGEGIDHVREMISTAVMEQQKENATVQNKVATDNIIADLEKDLETPNGES